MHRRETRTHQPPWLSSLISQLNAAAHRSAEYSERHFRIIGWLACLIPLAYVVDVHVGKPSFDTLAIRASAFLFAIPLIFHDVKFFRDRSSFHIYFVAIVTYALPFSFGLMLVMNAATAPDGSQIEMLWVLQYVISLFLFIQLIHNGLLSTVLWCVSVLALLLPLAFLERANWVELNRVLIYHVTGYLTAVFCGIITNRNVDYVNSEKLRAASAIGANIAHELRTPLASIRSLARAMNKYSQTLVDTYANAKGLNIHTGELTTGQIDGLRSALLSIEQEVAYSNTIIDMLLINTSEKSTYITRLESFAISEVIVEAIERFPFNNSNERALVHLHVTHDFTFSASRLLLIHVFFNLLKNGVHYAQKSKGGTVSVTVGDTSQQRCVEITDTGPGIRPAVRRYIFDRFYTTSDTSQGAGIGLSFCKMVMDSLGGTISCESVEGEYTTFRLLFP